MTPRKSRNPVAGARRWLLLLMLAGCSGEHSVTSTTGHSAEAAAADFERGPHNGRLLRDGDLALEITIFETGVPPEFRVFPFRNDQRVPPGEVELVIELGRLGNRIDRFEFSPHGDFLRGNGVVLEPHSFDMSVSAQFGGRRHSWTYDSYEGRTQIGSDIATAMGIEVASATAGKVRETVEVQGSILPHPDALTEVRGRFPGLVQTMQKAVGDTVRTGDALASILSNESLQTYVVMAPGNGTVISREATVGSASGNLPLYVIADMSRLIADFKVYARDIDRIRPGQSVAVSSLDGANSSTGIIERILPTLDARSRAATARVVLNDANFGWRSGQFVKGTVIVAEHDLPLVVRESGLQSFRDFTVVYARVGDTYEVRMLDLGRSDGEFVEVLGGLEPGTVYVTGNSYLIKADIEKTGASHDH